MRDVLFMAPSLNVASETWLRRMLDMLEPRIALIACDEGPSQRKGVDTLLLRRRDRMSRIWRKVMKSDPGILVLRRAIKKKGIKTIFINYATMAITTRQAWEDLDVEVFVHCHGWDIHFDACNEQWPPNRIHSEGYKEAVRDLSSRVIYIANSQNTKQALIANGVPAARIELKAFGVEDRGDVQRNPLPEIRPLKLLYLGRLVDFKGPDLVIRAFDLACQRGLQAELILAGDGPLFNACALLRHESRYCDRIKIIGPVDDEAAVNLYQDADIFLSHHRKGPISQRVEAFGVTMIEAMSYGLPIITGASGGVPESVIHEKTGFLVAPGDVESYVGYLLALSQDSLKRREMGANGIKHVRENFSIQQETKSLLRILGK